MRLSPFSGQWLVAGLGMAILVYIYIYILDCFSNFTVSVLSYRLFFSVCLLDASWDYWASKCCYYCCLFYTLKQWLLHLSSLPPHVGQVVWGLCFSLRSGLLCGNYLDRVWGIFNDRRHGDVFIPCLGSSFVAHVSLLEDVSGLGCKSETLLVEVIGRDVALGIGVSAALILYFLKKR